MDGGCGVREQELDVLPQNAGLAVADGYGGEILRTAPLRAAAFRLQDVTGSDGDFAPCRGRSGRLDGSIDESSGHGLSCSALPAALA
jgi:hypothetical protein